MKSLSRPVLVLNKMWIPIRVVTVKRCLKLVFADKASIVDPADYSVYSWEKWVTMDSTNDEYGIETTSGRIKIPEVIVLLNYAKVFIKDLRITKKNIYMRDKYRCQYTGRQVRHDEADIDHVIPKSRGGKNSWDNLVVCTKEINRVKADRTPEEAGLKLIRKPTAPKTDHFLVDPKLNAPDSWEKFIRKNK